MAARAPGKLEEHFSGGRVDIHQAGARHKQGVTLASHGRGDGSGISGFVVGGGPERLTGGCVKRGDARSIRSADVEEYAVAFDQGRTRFAEEAFGRGEFLLSVNVPQAFAGGEVQALENALGAEGE